MKTDYEDLDKILAACKENILLYREPKSFEQTFLKAVTNLWGCLTVCF